MKLTPQFIDTNRYIESSDIIDFGHQEGRGILSLSFEIKIRSRGKIEFIKNIFEYVRDEIPHSADINGRAVTCKASDVLKAREGICFAKSHLLAALLRCNHIPVGFCYQRLILDDVNAPYLILHGLNAVFIAELNRWVRLDARGNKPGVNAQFSLEEEKLAFSIRPCKGEEDIPVIFLKPDPNVISSLSASNNTPELWANLPTELAV